MNREKIEPATIVRTVCLVLALVNNLLTQTGHTVLPFTDEEIAAAVSWAVTAAVALWNWWKNNSFTQAAIKGDQVMREIKGKEK